MTLRQDVQTVPALCLAPPEKESAPAEEQYYEDDNDQSGRAHFLSLMGLRGGKHPSLPYDPARTRR